VKGSKGGKKKTSRMMNDDRRGKKEKPPEKRGMRSLEMKGNGYKREAARANAASVHGI
jgi:hypothetical protein